jgi:hypothetical protein
MKICAITMVYKDRWALKQWYQHYAKWLQPQNLYIVAHGPDPEIRNICKGANVATISRNSVENFDKHRNQLLNKTQDELAKHYDWVIRTDVDELICLEPEIYPDFKDLFEASKDTNCLFALGLDVVEAADDEELNDTDVALLKRRNAVFSGHYSKAFGVRKGVYLLRHGVVHTPETSFDMPKGVYLLHLKYANIDALQIANEHRVAIASGPETGLPGGNWREAQRRATRFLHRFEGLPHLDWERSQQMAYEAIALEPETQADKGVMRAKSVQFGHRTTLPDWMASG